MLFRDPIFIIKKELPQNLKESVVMAMNYTLEALLYGMQFRRLMEKELDPVQEKYGICRIDMEILLYLSTAGERDTSKDIMELSLFSRGHISQSLSRLQKKGYVSMEQDRRDRRCTHNHLTPEALAVVGQLRRVYEKVHGIVLNGVTEEERRVLAGVAQKVNRNISSAISD